MKILCIHGLSRTPLSLLSLARSLQGNGWETEYFGYFAATESFEQIVDRLRQKIQAIAQTSRYSIVAHSLGGVLTRAALACPQTPAPEQVVMLGTPNQPPRLASLAWQLPPFRWWTGQCGFNLTDTTFYQTLPTLEVPYRIIAGISGPRGGLSPFGDEPNDGIVGLTETHLLPTDEVIQLPVLHTFMMHHPQLQRLVKELLRQGDRQTFALW
ncbi:alpha/beta hydrolase [Synechococcus moorigangaii CMS01]|nr:alpha/beta hydrolase [Synechococcus moorigangaii CMS01]